MIYINEDYLKLEWNATDRMVVTTWKGFFSSEKFRAGLLKGLAVIAQHKAANWLGDVTDAKVTTIADQNYLAHEWTPQAIGRGLRRIAYVVPTDITAQQKMGDSCLFIQFFDILCRYHGGLDLGKIKSR